MNTNTLNDQIIASWERRYERDFEPNDDSFLYTNLHFANQELTRLGLPTFTCSVAINELWEKAQTTKTPCESNPNWDGTYDYIVKKECLYTLHGERCSCQIALPAELVGKWLNGFANALCLIGKHI